ncbi:MAG: radical SAM protein [Elusimicrobiota bacterium]
MKVAFINPGKSQRFAVHEPLNLGFIASYLEKNNVEVKIVDELAGQNVEEELEKFHPDVAGITATTALAPDAYRVASLCKKMGFLTVMGGVHASIFPDEAMKYVDIVVKGEGEAAMLDIINKKIKSGLVTAPYIKNIDDIPPPSRHLLQMDFYLRSKDRVPYIIYFAFVPPRTKVASLLTSRGCPYLCIFCHNTWRGTPCRFHSAGRVISEIAYLKEKYDVKAVYFVEDNFFLNKKRVHEICEQMIQKRFNLIWGGSTRVDNIDMETLEMAKAAGCRLINFGFESGSQRILDLLKKGINVEDSKRAIEMCNRAGIMANGSFIIGNPTETMDDIEQTRKFIRENKITLPGIYISTPYPGTGLWKMAREQGLIPGNVNWADFAQERVTANLSKIPKEKIEKLRAQLYLEYFIRHPRMAIKLLLMSLQYPKAPAEKILKTLAPLTEIFNARTIKKIAGGILTVSRVYVKALLFKLGLFVKPYNITWFITWRCNLLCNYCDIGRQNQDELKRQELTLEEIRAAVLQLKKIGAKYITFAGGEPLLREDLFDVIKFCKENNLVVGIVTNGVAINETIAEKLASSGVDHIHVSLDSPDDTQDEIRAMKGAFKKVDAGLRMLAKYKGAAGFHLGIGSVISRYNYNKLEKLFEYALDTGLDSVAPQPFFSYQMRDKKMLEKFVLSGSEITELEAELKRISEKYPRLLRNSNFFIKNIPEYFRNPKMPGTMCFAGGLTLIIFPEGNVGVCYPLHQGVAGNVRETEIGGIIKSEKFRQLVRKVRNKECATCWCAPVHEYNLFFKPREIIKSLRMLKTALTGK